MHSIFSVEKEDCSETSILEVENGFSMMSVSKSEIVEEHDGNFTFFRGWFQDNNSKSTVLGQTGFNEWRRHCKNNPSNQGYEGAIFSQIIIKVNSLFVMTYFLTCQFYTLKQKSCLYAQIHCIF